MQQIEDDFVSQLLSASLRPEDKTWTASQAASWIACAVPEDDAWTFLPEIVVRGRRVLSRAESGALVTIESID